MGKKTQEAFLQDCLRVHGSKYDYTLASYVDAKTKVKIICNVHGVFEQSPDNHVNSAKGCSACARLSQSLRNTKYKDTEDLIEKLNKVHNNKYEYFIDCLKTTKDKIDIVCPHHGPFQQRLDHHIGGRGCSKCQYNLLSDIFSLSLEGFIDKAIQVHGDTYDYSLVNYMTSQKKVEIICNIHGTFSQTANSHLNGNACPSCAKYGYQPNKAGVFYILKVGDEFIKFGISNNFKRRLNEINKGTSMSVVPLALFDFKDGTIPPQIESSIIKHLPIKSVVSKSAMSVGHTETTPIEYLDDILQIVKNYRK